MYNLKISKKQASIIIESLNLYSRLLCGQTEEISNLFMFSFFDKDISLPKVKEICNELKKTVFPELQKNESYGIYQDSIGENPKIAYDMIQVIRHKLAWDRKPDGGNTVDFGKPLKTSEKEDLAIIS